MITRVQRFLITFLCFLALFLTGKGEANVLYVNDEDTFTIGTETGTDPISLEFGDAGPLLQYNPVTGRFYFTQLVDFDAGIRIETANGTVAVPECDSANDRGKHYYDTADDNAYVCIETSPGVYEWFDYTATFTSTATKVVTVGSTGADYASIETASGYLNSLTGGIILLSPELHVINNDVDLESILLVGSNTASTILQVQNTGQLQVKDTQFKLLTLKVDSSLASSAAIDAKDVTPNTTAMIFEYVDFDIAAGKYLIDSSAAAAPILNPKFISTSATSSGSGILPSTGSANINIASELLVASQGDDGALQFNDWDVKIAGSANVLTSGTITTVPGDTIFVYPGMNLQAAVDSLPDGGIITLLPGIHSISQPLVLTNDSTEIIGYGDASIIRASGFSGITDMTAAISLGSADGTAPVNNIILKDFKVEVVTNNIHGVRAAGGSDLQLYNITVQKITGQSGTGATATIGIQFLDGTIDPLIRPVIKNCRIFGNGGLNYFTDGIHLSGGSGYGFAGIWTNGAGIKNALVEGNNVDYVRETVAVFIGVEDSSLFNNRFSRMGASGGTSYGLFLGNSHRVNMNANVVAHSLSVNSYGFVIENIDSGSLKEVTDSVFNSNTVDGTADGGVGFQAAFAIGNANNTGIHRNVFTANIVKGASNIVATAFNMAGDMDDNNFANNSLTGGTDEWDTGFNIQSATAERNTFRGTQMSNVTMGFTDNGTDTRYGVAQHRAASNPAVTDDTASGYSVGTVWINTSTDSAFISMDDTVGAAVWKQIDGTGGGGGSPTLQLAALQARRTTDFTLAALNTWYDIDLDTTDIQNYSAVLEHDPANADRFLIKENGVYRITYQVVANDSGVTHQLDTRVRVNDTTVLNGSLLTDVNYADEYGPTTGTFLASLTAGDFVSFQTQRTTANTILGETVFTMVKMDGVQGATGVDGAPGADGLPGADGDITWEGAWVAQNYTTNQAVTYQGSSYVCILNTVSNELPTNATYWELMAAKGDPGLPGSAGGGTISETFILDTDDTGGDLSLQFGTALTELLTWNATNLRFDLSDTLRVTGNLEQEGNVLTLDADNGGTGANVDIVANQGTDNDGVLRYNATENKWELSNDGGLFSAISTFVPQVFEAYDNTGNVTITQTQSVLNLDTTRIADSYYTLIADTVTINNDGIYKFTGRLSTDSFNTSGAARASVQMRFQLDTGGGFADVPGTLCQDYMREQNNGISSTSCSVSWVESLNAGDLVRITHRMNRTTTAQTIPQGSGMIVEFIR